MFLAVLALALFVGGALLTCLLGFFVGSRAAAVPPLALSLIAPLTLGWASFGAGGGSNMEWAVLSIACFIAGGGAWLGLLIYRRASKPTQERGTGLTGV